MRIRPAEPREAEFLTELVMTAKAHWGYTARQLDGFRPALLISAEQLRTQPSFVIEDDGVVLGFCSLRPNGPVCELDNLWVAPAAMGRGSGRALLAHAADAARRLGFAEIAIDADPSATPFYVRCGAVVTGDVPAPIDGEPDRRRPQLRLATAAGAPSSVHVVRHADASAFLAAARDWLMRDEVENNVLLSVAGAVADGTRADSEPPYFASAHRGDAVVCCAMRTPPHRLVVSTGPDDALQALACDARDAFGSLPGVTGPTAAASAFATAWSVLSIDRVHVSMRFRIHAIRRVADDLPRADGALQVATAADRPLALAWLTAFAEEALPHQPNEAEAAVDRLLRKDALFLWCDGQPVALCASGGRTSNSARIGPVYTSPAFRGRGYATAAVAELTRRLLADCSWCCLYTDLANPVSNSIYRRIGYRPVVGVDEYTFVAAGH
jgi:predicted GNAT family acetyltransferase/predicted N-acetyltransferase YhbS